jgi:hypothetical protein
MISEVQEQQQLLTVADAKKLEPRIGYRRILNACKNKELVSALDGNRYTFERADFYAWVRKYVLRKPQ